jgi:LuxR family maltose regulon positive regulatory protein
LRLISRGHSNKRVAQALGIAVDTVKTHAKNIFIKLDAANRAQAVSRAERLGLI